MRRSKSQEGLATTCMLAKGCFGALTGLALAFSFSGLHILDLSAIPRHSCPCYESLTKLFPKNLHNAMTVELSKWLFEG